MAGSRDIAFAVIGETLRLVLFLVYYIALICLGIAILIGAVYVACHLAFNVLPRVAEMNWGEGTHGMGMTLIIGGVIVGVLSLAGIFGIYLVKPLFSVKKNINNERVEVTESECPKLFQLIRDLSRTTGFRMPRHVYLTTDTDAKVFYNIGFWSIFLPVRKNLEIGLGIFNSTTVQEVKAILAHEFGHFGQRSMKVGSAVSVTSKVLYNLICTDDFVDRTLSRWRDSVYGTRKILASLAYALTSIVRNVTVHVFVFVQRGDRKLAQLMEFAADGVACQCAGSKAFISAMCKRNLLSACDRHRLRPFLNTCLAANMLPDNYFMAHAAMVEELSESEGWPQFGVNDFVEKPFDFGIAESRIKFVDAYSTHPALEDRLEHARKLAVTCENDTAPSWSLIPESIIQKVSDRYLDKIASLSTSRIERVGTEDFRRMFVKYRSENAFPLRYAVFFNRELERFDICKAFETERRENPFTDEYRRLVVELNTAITDMGTLENIASGETEVDEFTYRGVVYCKWNAPIEEHRQYLGHLAGIVAERDAAACSYLTHLGDTADHEFVKFLYLALKAVEVDYWQFASHLARHDERIEKDFRIFETYNDDDKLHRKVCSRIVALETAFRNGVSKLNWKFPGIIPNDQRGKALVAYASRRHNDPKKYDKSLFKEIHEYRKLFYSMYCDYRRRCKIALARFAEQHVKQGGQE